MIPSILIIEDDLTFSTMLKTWLGKKGFDVETAGTCAKARKQITSKEFSLILSDLRLPDQDGMQLLTWMRELDINTPFIMMTSYGEIQNAVTAMKLGATDYVKKPVQPDELLKKINEALESQTRVKPSQQKEKKKENSAETYANNFLEGESEAARQLFSYVNLVAPTQMSVLINGASGTGKEYVAHRIHQLSKRNEKPFIAIDCGSIPKDLAASEFFGHVKGSFTGALTDKTGAFEEANGGTLFLDEIGNLSYEVQVQLLRAIQERRIRPVGATQEIEVDVRLICATNENLPEAIAKGEFREDLYHRLNEFTLHMPLLKDRGEDILLFADFFLQQANKELEKDILGFDISATQAMLNYSWPGNLRQLKNIVKRATLLAHGEFIRKEDLGNELNEQTSFESPSSSGTLKLFDESTEKERILQALHATQYNKSKAAQLLGIDRKTLYNKLKIYNIPQS